MPRFFCGYLQKQMKRKREKRENGYLYFQNIEKNFKRNLLKESFFIKLFFYFSNKLKKFTWISKYNMKRY